MSDFAVGDRVHIAGLGTGIVREIRNGGRFVVDIKGRAMIASGSQMTPAAERTRRRKEPSASGTSADDQSSDPGSASLDLHGKTVLEAVEALDAFLNDALLDGRREIRIVHGRSGGRVKAAVHARLGALAPVRAFRLDPANPGVTIVAL